MPFYLGIDSGTQSTKALVLDGDLRVVGRGQAPHRMVPGLAVGHAEQDPSTWVEALEVAMGMALAEAGIPPRDITAIGVSAQQHGFVPLDGDHRVIRPAKLWCDTSTAAEAAEITAAAGGTAGLLGATGNTLPPGFTASKILWMKRHEPDHFRRLRTILLPHDYLNFHLTGELRMEHGDASGTGLLDVRNRRWAGDVLALVDDRMEDLLPPLAESALPCGHVCSVSAARLGLSPHCLVSAGGGDNMMGAIGTGNVAPGIVTTSLGTSGTIYAFSPTPVIDGARGEIAAFCDSTGGWLPLLCTMNVTVATELTRKTFGLGLGELESLATAVPPGSDGLMLLPYFEGERVPNVPDGTGVWLGYNGRTHDRGHFGRAAMEGPSLGLAHGFQRLLELGVIPAEIRLTGGGARSALWRQILTNCLGVPSVCTTEPESAALGAALQTAWCHMNHTGHPTEIADLCHRAVTLSESTRSTVDDEAHAIYRDLLAIHQQCAAALGTVFTSHRQWLDKQEPR